MKLLVLLLLAGWCSAQDLPEAPQPQPIAHLMTFRANFNAPALHPDKKSWVLFVGMHAAAFGALAVSNHQKEHPGSEGAALGALTGLDFVVFKTVNPLMSLGGAEYGIFHYLRAR